MPTYKLSRLPTDEEIASAFDFIDAQYTLVEGNIDGEQWAEGLAFGRPIERFKACDPTWHSDLMRIAREMRPQLTEDQWRTITCRADYRRAQDGYRGTCEEPFGTAPRYRAQGSV